MKELQINVALEKGIITTNFSALKTNISEQMQVYKELEVTEVNKTERKKDVATLRKMKKAVNDKKISVKEEFMKPYMEFDTKVKELLAVIDEPITLIDNQVKELEDKQRETKKLQIKQLFDVAFADLKDNVSLERIYDDKWLNATVTLKQVKEDLSTKSAEIRQAATLIKEMQSDKSEYALTMYYDTLDLASAMSYINRYEQQKREIEKKLEEDRKREQERELERERERVREEERQRIREEERIKQEAKQEGRQEVIEEQQEALSVKHTLPAANNTTAQYTVVATEDELQQVEMYMDSIGVTWERS